ncbi:MAG: thioredoxin family protein [Betaproteobacteria bacterium]|nr:thioredoxin family protein [Betaproteobacteria bacterium]
MNYLLLPLLVFGLNLSSFAAIEPGEEAPDFTLTDSKGTSHKLSDFRGKFVVLEWLNHECPFVKKHYSGGDMQKLQKEYTAKGVVWLSIISSAPGKQGHRTGPQAEADTKDKNAAPTAVLLDPSGEVGKKYDAKTTPEMFVLDKEGKILYAGAIDSIKSTDSADIAKAENHVRAALDAALAGQPVPTPKTKPYGCSVKY